MGQAFRRLQDYDKALFYLNLAVEKQQDDVEFLIERSNIYVDMKKRRVTPIN